VNKGIDLSKCPQLESLTISSPENIQNISDSSLSKIHFTHIEKIENIVEFLSMPNLDVELDFYAENDDRELENIFSLSSENDKVTIQRVLDISCVESDDYLEHYANKLETAIKMIKSIRNADLYINPSCRDKEFRKHGCFDIACFLSRTKLLTKTEIAKLVLQSPE